MKKDWAEAESHFTDVLEHNPDSKFVPEAIYYKGVSRYSGSHDHNVLGDTAEELNKKYPENEWQLRSIPWLRKKTESTTVA
jgi:TolA-binding protein